VIRRAILLAAGVGALAPAPASSQVAPPAPPAPASTQLPAWVAALGYREAELIEVRTGPLGMPLVQVEVASTPRWLLFDTGDMVGVSLTTGELASQELPVDSTWRRLDSDGRVLGEFRRLRSPSVRAFGRELGPLPVYEMDELVVPGLIGPDLLPGSRFTLDYRAGVLAVTDTPLDVPPQGFDVLRLVRSRRHPRLILAYCRIGNREVLTEFDTGKSRTVIAPDLARELGLVADERGVRIDSLGVGSATFAIPSAKLVPLADIDRSLPAPIELSVGSDVMSELLITVDYATGRMLIADTRRPYSPPGPAAFR